MVLFPQCAIYQIFSGFICIWDWSGGRSSDLLLLVCFFGILWRIRNETLVEMGCKTQRQEETIIVLNYFAYKPLFRCSAYKACPNFRQRLARSDKQSRENSSHCLCTGEHHCLPGSLRSLSSSTSFPCCWADLRHSNPEISHISAQFLGDQSALTYPYSWKYSVYFIQMRLDCIIKYYGLCDLIFPLSLQSIQRVPIKYALAHKHCQCWNLYLVFGCCRLV